MKIFVLESLRNEDPKTGKYVHEFLDKKGISNEFHTFHTKQELIDLLGAIKIKSASEDFQPFVHFDCHGNENGIAVVKKDNTEELITWKDIRTEFRNIYMASKRKAVICMSSCQGFNAIKLVAQCEPCPYDHVCGSFEKISFSDSYYGYTKFYELILEGKTIFDSAVEVHNDDKHKDMKFIGVNSQTLFKMAIDGYLEKECTEEKLKEKKELYQRILGQYGTLDDNQKEYLEKAFSLEGQKVIIERCAETFFSLK
jgi:hypothetical protein